MLRNSANDEVIRRGGLKEASGMGILRLGISELFLVQAWIMGHQTTVNPFF